MRVGEVCIRSVVHCSKVASALEAGRVMRDHHIGNVVIVDERSGREVPIGVVTDRDIVVQLAAKEVDPADITVTDLMGRELFVASEEDIHDVIQRIRYRGVRRLPVIDQEGALVGVIALDDLLRHIAAESRGYRSGVLAPPTLRAQTERMTK